MVVVIEFEAIRTIAALVMTRHDIVDECVDVRQLNTVADFEAANGDVASGLTIDLNGRPGSAIDGELLMLRIALGKSKDAQACA